MNDGDEGTEALLQRVSRGDAAARDDLLARFRPRLKRMVAIRMDPRIAARFDSSDVVQEALLEAHQRLPDYLEKRPVPFYTWLRQIAWEKLVKLYTRHLHAQKRSVRREEVRHPGLSDGSARELASRLIAKGTNPSTQAIRQELLGRFQAALGGLSRMDREILILRHLEHLSIAEMAAVLGLTEGAVKVRRLRALQRLRDLLGSELEEQRP